MRVHAQTPKGEPIQVTALLMSRRRFVIVAAILAVLAGGLIYVGTGRGYPLQTLIVPILLHQFFVFGALVGQGLRMKLFARGRVGALDGARGAALVMTGTLLFPGRLAELLKPGYFNRRLKIPVSDSLSWLVLERGFDMLMVAGLFLVAVTMLPVQQIPALNIARWTVAVAAVVAFGGLAAIITMPRLLRRLVAIVPLGPLRDFAERSIEEITRFRGWSLVLRTLLLSVVIWLCAWGSFWVFFAANDLLAITPVQSLIVFVVATLGLVVAVTPGGLGTFEAAVALTLVGFGLGWDDALVSAVGLRVATYLASVALTVQILVRDGPIMLPGVGRRKTSVGEVKDRS